MILALYQFINDGSARAICSYARLTIREVKFMTTTLIFFVVTSTLLCRGVVTITTRILFAVIGPQTRKGKKKSWMSAGARKGGWLIPLTRCFPRFCREWESVDIYMHINVYIYIFSRLHLSYTRTGKTRARHTEEEAIHHTTFSTL